MSITKQLLPAIGIGEGKGNQKTLPVDPSIASTQSAAGGLGFLDQLGGAFTGALPSILDNLTKKDEDPAPVYIQPDQTAVHGDAALTKNDEANFLEKNWKYIAGGLLVVGGLIYVAKK